MTCCLGDFRIRLKNKEGRNLKNSVTISFAQVIYRVTDQSCHFENLILARAIYCCCSNFRGMVWNPQIYDEEFIILHVSEE